MTSQTTGRHIGAPRRPWWRTVFQRPAPSALATATALKAAVAEAPVRPSMELPAGHISHRPFHKVVLGAESLTPVFRLHDPVDVIVEGEFCSGRTGTIEKVAPWKPTRPFGVVIQGFPGLTWFDANEIAHPVGENPDDAATLTIAAFDVDEMPLMGGAR
jgi:hypothetical protein